MEFWSPYNSFQIGTTSTVNYTLEWTANYSDWRWQPSFRLATASTHANVYSTQGFNQSGVRQTKTWSFTPWPSWTLYSCYVGNSNWPMTWLTIHSLSFSATYTLTKTWTVINYKREVVEPWKFCPYTIFGYHIDWTWITH